MSTEKKIFKKSRFYFFFEKKIFKKIAIETENIYKNSMFVIGLKKTFKNPFIEKNIFKRNI